MDSGLTDEFFFKQGKRFRVFYSTPYNLGESPYTYTKYTDAEHATLDRTGVYTGNNDDVVNVILGGSWRMPAVYDIVDMLNTTIDNSGDNAYALYINSSYAGLANCYARSNGRSVRPVSD